MSSIKLRVEDARERDRGKGIARLNQKTMQLVKVSAGDTVEIVGNKPTASIAWPAYSEDQDKDIVRIDSFTCMNCGVAINDYVTIKKAFVRDAAELILAPPLDMKLNVDEDFANFVKNRLKNRPLVTGDWTIIRILGHEMTLKVMGTVPDGIVQVTRETIVQIQNTMLEQKPISPFNPELRKRIIDMISFKADLGFPLAETDFTPEHRQEISELAQMLEKCETLVNRAIKAKQDMLLLRNFWRKDALKREWIQSLNECEQLKKEVDQRIIAIASSIKKYPPSFIHIDFQRFLDAMKNKGIILEKIQCPHCGGMLEVTEVPKKEEVLKCKYCGFSILAINLFEKFKEMLRP